MHHTYEEYLDLLDVSTVKLEYCDGEIYAQPDADRPSLPVDEVFAGIDIR